MRLRFRSLKEELFLKSICRAELGEPTGRHSKRLVKSLQPLACILQDIYIYVYIYIYIYIYLFIYVYSVYTHTYTHIYNIYIYICMYAYVYVCVYIYPYYSRIMCV